MMVIKEIYDLSVEEGSWATSCNPMKEETKTALGKLIEVLQKDKKMHEFKTGAKRSDLKPRYDLIPKVAIDRLAKRFTGESVSLNPLGDPDALFTKSEATGGALKYGECNWEKGLPTSDVINHIYDHLTTYVNQFRVALRNSNGDMNFVQTCLRTDSKREDDLAAAMWGIVVLMHQEDSKMYHDDRFTVFYDQINEQSNIASDVGSAYSDGYVETLIKDNKTLRELTYKLENELNAKHRKSVRRKSRKVSSRRR